MKIKIECRNNAHSAGFTLIELMIALVIGAIIASALGILFVNVMQSNREQFKAAQQIENGRFAIDLLSVSLKHAGYYGEFATLPKVPSALPDPCDIPAQGLVTESSVDNPFSLYVQGYSPASLTTAAAVPTACQALIDATTLKSGSDILVVRRLDTKPLRNPPVTASTVSPVSGEVYAQTISGRMYVQYGGASAIDGTKDATGAANASEMTRKDFTQATVGTPPVRPLTAAYIRKVHVEVYFVANCRNGTGAGGQCTASDDKIPTLKRLELVVESGARKMKMIPLAEGIEFFRVRYGLDTDSHIAGKTFDGSVDSLVAASAVSLANWQNVVMVELRVLARNSDLTINYTDNKTYDLGGGVSFTPTGDAARFKRHAFTSQVYLVNPGGWRES